MPNRSPGAGSALIFAAALAALTLWPLPSLARPLPGQVDPVTRRALLIGVSDYPLLPATGTGPTDLLSTPRDIAGMIRAARDLGVGDAETVVLADKIDPMETARQSDGLPTRNAILSQMDRLAMSAGPGDQILIYFTGHGSQAPDKADRFGQLDEGDGKDEIILPIDIGRWDGALGEVRNAITDDEIGRAVTAIRKKGAYVWLVVDACHAGTALRGAPSHGAEDKAVPPGALGVPDEAFQEAAKSARRAARRGRQEATIDADALVGGGVTAFYAAQDDQTAKAFQFEPNTPAMGFLTYALTQGLAAGRVRTYRDLALVIRAAYEQPRVGRPRDLPSPAFEGDFDREIMGLDQVPPHKWQITRRAGRIAADGGWLDGLREGGILAVRDAAQPDSAPTAYLRAAKVEATATVLEPVAHADRPVT